MNQEYTQRLLKIETELKRWLPEKTGSNPAWNEQVFTGIAKNAGAESISFLTEPLIEILYRGGKRWRPLFMTLVCEALGGGDAAVPLSPVVEFSHNASLIHDDIEDESDERRGKPAVHKMFGVDTAINSGSFFYFLAACCMEAYVQNSLRRSEQIYKYWAECMRKLHLGQAMDINWHRNIPVIPKIEEYLLMCRLKTGSLARLAAELGAYTANAPQETARILGEAADTMGVGFQILDDVKNLTTGNPGKKRGDDIVEGKKSLPVLLYLNKFPQNKEKIFYCFHVAKNEGSRSLETEELINILNESGVIAEAEEKGKSLLKETQDVFNMHDFAGFPVREGGAALLNGFLELIT